MTNMEQRINAMCAVMVADTIEERKKAVADLKLLMQNKEVNPKDAEYLIREMFMEMGVPDHLIGYDYAVAAIRYVADDRNMLQTISTGLYPTLAAEFNATAPRIERGIRHLISETMDRGNKRVIDRYFGTLINSESLKITNGEFIARMANLVKQRMR